MHRSVSNDPTIIEDAELLRELVSRTGYGRDARYLVVIPHPHGMFHCGMLGRRVDVDATARDLREAEARLKAWRPSSKNA
jgi:hypothetical protein